MKYDLHVHSIYSDGIKTPIQLAEESMSAGLAGFALTDHDTIDGWKEIKNIEEKYPITVFPGVELSTVIDGRDVHILGYCMKDLDTFSAKLKELAESRSCRVVKIVEKLNELGVLIEIEEVRKIAGSGTIGRPHVASAMVFHGYVKDKQSAFERYLNRGKPAYVERMRFTPMEAVKLIKDCGGYAVFAHPGLDHAFEFTEELCEYGLDGIEVHHSSHTIVNSRKFAEIAKELNLIQTSGSDYHGHSESSHGRIGSVAVEEEHLPYFLTEYLEEHRKYVERV